MKLPHTEVKFETCSCKRALTFKEGVQKKDALRGLMKMLNALNGLMKRKPNLANRMFSV